MFVGRPTGQLKFRVCFSFGFAFWFFFDCCFSKRRAASLHVHVIVSGAALLTTGQISTVRLMPGGPYTSPVILQSSFFSYLHRVRFRHVHIDGVKRRITQLISDMRFMSIRSRPISISDI